MNRIYRLLTLSLVVLIIASFAGCSADNSDMQSQMDDLRSQLDEANSKIQELEQEREQTPDADTVEPSEPETAEPSQSEDESSTAENSSTESSAPSSSADEATTNSSTVINITSNGQKNLTDSSSFTASAGQTLTLEVKSTITGGTVDFFLFSPSNQEQRFTFSGDDTQTVSLSAGTWAYNCTGFFESGDITITGTVQ